MGRNIQDPYKDRCFFSVVFKAFDYQPNDNGKWKAVCNEYVFNPLEVEENRTIGTITQDCAKLSEGKPISINGVSPTTRTAIVPKKPNKVVPPNNQELNTEQYMNKKLIRLTEGDLHRIVKESVQKILNEADGWQTYDDTNMSPEEKAFRATISPNFNQSAIEYLGKLSNGNTLVTIQRLSHSAH